MYMFADIFRLEEKRVIYINLCLESRDFFGNLYFKLSVVYIYLYIGLHQR